MGLGFFKSLGVLVCRAYGDDIPPVELWAKRVAKISPTPEAIIAEAIIQSIAKDFDAWKHEGEAPTKLPTIKGREFATKAEAEATCRCVRPERWRPVGGCLVLTKGELSFRIGCQKTDRDGDNQEPWFYVNECVVIDGKQRVNLSFEEGLRICQAWNRLHKARLKAKEVADKAKADMEANETAWNLVEKLLGMKRNEYGALVPVRTVEEEANVNA